MTREEIDRALHEIESALAGVTAFERRPIPGYDGYEADSDGHIWSCESNWRGYGQRQLVESIERDGYLHVRLYRDGKRIRKTVHTLIALAFYGERPVGMQARHLDGVRTHNAPNNLAWGTAKENAADREKHGTTCRGDRHFTRLHPERLARGDQSWSRQHSERLARGDRNGARLHPDRLLRGSRHTQAKLTEDAVREIRALHANGMPCVKIAKLYGVASTTADKIVHRKAWKHVE